jgi:siroheme synthase-like protein
MQTLAANLDLRDREALLIGAGAVGRRKLRYLLGTGARLTVVEPRPAPWLMELSEAGELTLVGEFSLGLLEGMPLVFAALGGGLPEGLLAAVKERGLWLNVAGSPERGNFTLPALVDDPPFRLAVSTGGASPALAARVARTLREGFRGYGDLCRLLSRVRPLVLSSGLEEGGRRAIFLALAESEALSGALAGGRLEEAQDLLQGIMGPIALPPGFSLGPGKE